MMDSNKKLSIICILKILQEFSDEEHILTQQDIIKKLCSSYGLKCERKSIGASIESLIDFGYDIEKTQKGCFLAQREFEKSEISFLIDAVFSTKTLSSKQAQELTKKLTNLISVNQRKSYKFLYKSNEISRTSNKQIFYTIDILNEAIEKHKKVDFVYNWYNENKELVPKSEKKYIVSPYFMVNNNGKYYLVCNNEYFDNISNFRIDLITNISILKDNSKPLTSLPEYSNGLDITNYINSNIYMFGSKDINATLKLKDNYSINVAIDWFGKNINIYKKGNEIFANVKANEEALIYWCLQYGEYAELIEPYNTKQKLREKINNLNNIYGRK